MDEGLEARFKNLFQELLEKKRELDLRVSLLENFIARNSLYFLVFDREERVRYHNLPNRKNPACLSEAEFILRKDIIGQIRKHMAQHPSGAFEVVLKSGVLEFILFTHENHGGLFFLQITLFKTKGDPRNAGEEREYFQAETGFKDLSPVLSLLEEIKKIESAERKKRAYGEIQGHYLPALDRFKENTNDPIIRMCLEIIRNNLREVIAPPGNISALYKILTPSEIKVADFIRMGKSSQDIAEALDIARKTVENHRNKLRDKLGLKNKGVNLRSYLLKLDADGTL
ncbi:MAG: helix-turn-helix transcriptional regulator [Spirochaetaceae bacterium]|jgi:DNA-binding CsgD family transcriptional regulator|nr:helix-turn-helix transcriptional regulator [Spirochaetaceae bacterium]